MKALLVSLTRDNLKFFPHAVMRFLIKSLEKSLEKNKKKEFLDLLLTIIFLTSDLCFWNTKKLVLKALSTNLKNMPQQLKLWSSCIVLGSQSEGCGFNPCPMLAGNGVKAMPA